MSSRSRIEKLLNDPEAAKKVREEELKTSKSAVEGFQNALKQGDFDKAVSFYAEDAAIVHSNENKVYGKKDAAAFLKSLHAPLGATHTIAEAASIGDYKSAGNGVAASGWVTKKGASGKDHAESTVFYLETETSSPQIKYHQIFVEKAI